MPQDPDLDDAVDFQRMDQAMDAVGISVKTKMDIYRVVAAVLHLGNVNFEENDKDKKGIPPVSKFGFTFCRTNRKMAIWYFMSILCAC